MSDRWTVVGGLEVIDSDTKMDESKTEKISPLLILLATGQSDYGHNDYLVNGCPSLPIIGRILDTLCSTKARELPTKFLFSSPFWSITLDNGEEINASSSQRRSITTRLFNLRKKQWSRSRYVVPHHMKLCFDWAAERSRLMTAVLWKAKAGRSKPCAHGPNEAQRRSQEVRYWYSRVLLSKTKRVPIGIRCASAPGGNAILGKSICELPSNSRGCAYDDYNGKLMKN